MDLQLQNPSLFITEAFIDGKWVKKDKTFDVYGPYPGSSYTSPMKSLLTLSIEPSTGTIMGQVVNCDLQDFQRAIQSGHDIQNTFFSTTTGAARGALLRKWCDLILANKEDGETLIRLGQ